MRRNSWSSICSPNLLPGCPGTSASDLSAGGANFDNAFSKTAPGATNLALTITNTITENDYAFTPAGDPGVGGTSTGTFTVTWVMSFANTDLQHSVQLARVNSVGTISASTAFTAEQTSASSLTFSFTNPALGTWASGDRLRVTFRVRDTSTMNNESVDYAIGSSGVQISAPWSESQNITLGTATSTSAAATPAITYGAISAIPTTASATATATAPTVTIASFQLE